MCTRPAQLSSLTGLVAVKRWKRRPVSSHPHLGHNGGMRKTGLRRTLMEVVLLAAPAAALLGCEGRGEDQIDAPYVVTNPCDQNSFTVTRHVAEPPPAELIDLVRACEADVRQCEMLCWQILYAENIPSSPSLRSCTVEHAATSHTITVGYCYVGAEGRRPPGLARARKRCVDATGGHLARAAFYEAASVHAFVQLARELRHHRAPRTLVQAVRRSAAEEIGHARAMAGLARAKGATPPPLTVTRSRCRSLETIALENAREGVVGETWSAMIALWQSHHAPTAALRATYAQIAADELRHAELALELHDWTCQRLRPAARKRVEAERERAIAGLARGVRRSPNQEIVRELGMPDRAASQQLFENARARLWA